MVSGTRVELGRQIKKPFLPNAVYFWPISPLSGTHTLSCCVALRQAGPETCQRNGVPEERESDLMLSFPSPANLPPPELSSVAE